MSEYSGTDNLEVMAEAINYNQYLIDLVSRCAANSRGIVDFGAGIGTFAKEMKRNGYVVHCVEPDDKQRRLIEREGLSAYPFLDSIGSNSIEYLYSLNVLEHIGDDESALKKIYHSLRPGGRALLYVPAFEVLFSSMDKKVGHFRRYTKKELTKKLLNANFIIEKARYVDCAGFFASLLFRFVGDSSGKLNVKALIFYDRIIFPVSRLFDGLMQYFFGKNVWVLVSKPVTDKSLSVGNSESSPEYLEAK